MSTQCMQIQMRFGFGLDCVKLGWAGLGWGTGLTSLAGESSSVAVISMLSQQTRSGTPQTLDLGNTIRG